MKDVNKTLLLKMNVITALYKNHIILAATLRKSVVFKKDLACQQTGGTDLYSTANPSWKSHDCVLSNDIGVESTVTVATVTDNSSNY